MAMKWTRSYTIGLSTLACGKCGGAGLLRGLKGTVDPCPCVLRKVFKIVWKRYTFGRLEQRERGAPILNCSGLGKRAHRQPGGFSFDLECFLADFVLVAKRALSADEFRFFSAAYLSGADWKRAHESVGMNRAHFIDVCNRVEATLGRAFSETRPFALFPLDAYFSRPAPGSRTPVFPATRPARPIPLVPPLAQRQPLKRAA